MSINKKTTLVSAVLVSSVLLSGCGLFGGEAQKKIDPPKSVTYTNDGNKTTVTEAGKDSAKEEGVQNSLKTELYLLDKNGYVVPQTLELPKTDGVAKQAVEYLVENGPVSEMLPNGFRAVLPAETQVSVAIKDGVAVVDFSKEFKNYQPEDELKILQSVTWTLTQFDSVKEVKMKMNGHELTEMPVNGTPISEGMTRASGINIDTSEVTDIMNTKPVTVYYLGGEEGSYYYVPVTRRVSNNMKDNVEAVVNQLVHGPGNSSSLMSDFQAGVKLVEAPKVENGKVTLNFNESVFGSFEEKVISQHLLNALVLSLTEQKGIESVAVMVNGKAELVDEEGKKLTEPVTRPEKVNTGSF
ncbi:MULTISPECIES: GerMN domain-containing protein [unclassified Bacillus (in: firmicutes)]|uniref:GerMN domain-containing protein n=1 Tax=unclassified Bacillus (in: firmicutes) TaxID=185979 RepID=UPI0008E45635|nr:MULTISPECIES: GerMN domain-containing protein [unclassified Bacillus (in: firmicutes)]SFB16674.1 germination protein M [Bacillus sp. UNCCL13]SFQ77902.1 germination protein M [Bacillus sp. cl95]